MKTKPDNSKRGPKHNRKKRRKRASYGWSAEGKYMAVHNSPVGRIGVPVITTRIKEEPE